MAKRVGFTLIGLMLVGWSVWMSWPGEKAPWWYSDSQVGWEHDHQITPVGYDEISQYIINSHGITIVPWKPNEFWAFIGCAYRYEQWIGDKLLVRMKDGKDSAFGGDDLHPPLKVVPDDKNKLQQCLGENDDGKLHFVERGKSIFEMMEESGAKVTK